MLKTIFPLVKHVLVNMLDLDLFVADFSQIQFHTVSVFVPDGEHPPLPFHSVSFLVRSNIAVKLEFSQALQKRFPVDMAVQPSLLKELLQSLLQWISGSGTGDPDDVLREQLNELYVHHDGQMDVAFKKDYRDKFLVSPRRRPLLSYEPEWSPTAKHLRDVLNPLYIISRLPVWLDITKRNRNRPRHDEFPLPRESCASHYELRGEFYRPLIQRNVWNGHVLRVSPLAEFYESSTSSHHLNCLFFPYAMASSRIFLEIYPREYTGSPVEDTARPVCRYACHATMPEEDLKRVLPENGDDAVSDIASERDEFMQSGYEEEEDFAMKTCHTDNENGTMLWESEFVDETATKSESDDYLTVKE